MKETIDLPDYPDYAKREQVKQAFRDRYQPEESVAERANLLVRLQIWAHYWRARQNLEEAHPPSMIKKITGINIPGYQLEIDLYATHWLWANGERWDPEVIEEVKKTWHYEPVESEYLPKGASIYVICDGK